MRPLILSAAGFLLVVFSLLAIMSVHIVDEGHVGVVTHFGEAKSQEGPGLTIVMPFVQDVEDIEVRERRTVEELAAATGNQLPINVIVSANWTIDSEAALQLFQRYGGLTQFENRIFAPNLRQAAKAILPQFQADQLIRSRQEAVAGILSLLRDQLSTYPLTINSFQIENITLPQRYMDSVLAKEQAREDAAKEQFRLDQQALEAQREVQTAAAQRDAEKARADGRAYATRTQALAEAERNLALAQAEAEGLNAIAEALQDNPRLIEYEKAKRWDGVLPQMLLGDTSPDLLLQAPQ